MVWKLIAMPSMQRATFETLSRAVAAFRGAILQVRT
jgi:hypothetical protein